MGEQLGWRGFSWVNCLASFSYGWIDFFDLTNEDQIERYFWWRKLKVILDPLLFFGTVFLTMFRYAAWGEKNGNLLKRIFLTGAVAFDFSLATLFIGTILTTGPIVVHSFSLPMFLMFHMAIGIISLVLWYKPGNMAYFKDQVTEFNETP